MQRYTANPHLPICGSKGLKPKLLHPPQHVARNAAGDGTK